MSTVVCEDYFEYAKKRLIREIWKKAIVTLRSDGTLYKNDKLVKKINKDTPYLNDYVEQKNGTSQYILQIPDAVSRKKYIRLRCLSVTQHNEWKQHLKSMYSLAVDEIEGASMSQAPSSSRMMDEEGDDDSDISLPESDDSADQAKLKVQNWIKTVNQRASANDDLKDHDTSSADKMSAPKNLDSDDKKSNDDDDEPEEPEPAAAADRKKEEAADDEFLDVQNDGDGDDSDDHSSAHGDQTHL